MTDPDPQRRFDAVLKATTLELARQRAEAARSLDALFTPRGVAVVGASQREGSVGRAVFANLQATYGGVLVPVNPRRERVLGVPCGAVRHSATGRTWPPSDRCGSGVAMWKVGQNAPRVTRSPRISQL